MSAYMFFETDIDKFGSNCVSVSQMWMKKPLVIAVVLITIG